MSLPDKIKTVIITGLSGSGKSTALNSLEDIGYYAIDNLPVFLLSDLLNQAGKGVLHKDRLALVMDCRDPSLLPSFASVLDQINNMDLDIIFLEADEEVLLRRFSQLRRRHPLATGCSVRQAIVREKELLEPLKKLGAAINTSSMSPHELARKLRIKYAENDEDDLVINLLSFGFKHGPPPESESLWDVRFLPNPYFIPALKSHTGQDKDVAEYVLENDTSHHFFELLEPMLLFLLKGYVREGKKQLTISIGCTGGKHRSVAVTERLKHFLSSKGFKLLVEHRDITKS